VASLNDQSSLALDINFQTRVRLALVAAATAVAGEAVGAFGPEHYNKRQSLARSVLSAPDSQVIRFAVAVATNSTVAGGYGPPVAITSSTAVNPSVVTTATHGLSTGDNVVIAGHLTNTAINGGWVVTVLTTTTFSVPVLGIGAGTAGIVRKMPPDADIAFTVSSLWDDMAGVTAND
jgi:hypothetical protein